MANVQRSPQGHVPERRIELQPAQRLFVSLTLPLFKLTLPLILLTSLGSIACSRQIEAPPASALKQARQDSKLDREHLEMERRHVAPPPAYGNKVVMAEGTEQVTAEF